MPIYSLLLLAMPVPPAVQPNAAPQPHQPPAIGEMRFSRTGMAGAVAVSVDRVSRTSKTLAFRRDSTPRGGATQTHGTDTAACPGSAELLMEAETLPMPRPDVPVIGAGPTTLILDGADYRLEGHAIHRDGQPGRFSIASNAGSPLALWVDRMFKLLEPCWRPVR